MHHLQNFIFLGLAGILCFPSTQAIVDLNGNGVSDVWEYKYHATSLVADTTAKNSDADADGQSNYLESLAGTDPRDATSIHKIDSITRTGHTVTLVCITEKGKTYQPSISDSLLTGSWSLHGSPQLAASNSMNASVSNQSSLTKFYRVTVNDIDSDADGIPNWAEEQLEGFDAHQSDSFAAGSVNHDLIVLSANLNAIKNGDVSIAATTPDAFEKEETPAVFTISRSGSTTYPLTVFIHTSGDPDTTKSSASTADYTLKDINGEVIDRNIVIPAGASSVEIHCHPVNDSLIEVPETLTCTIGGSNASASVRICDATNIAENNRLFVAQLSPDSGVGSSGSGLATILLQGDNSIGQVSLTFYGLTGTQNSALIHVKSPITGPVVKGLPKGQVDNHSWQLAAAHFLTTDQAVLDSLLASQLYIGIASSTYPLGELRGDFLPSTGSTSLVIPAEPPSITNLTGDALDQDIARFLTQSTFGPTPALITELRTLIQSAPHNGDRISGYSAWLDTQAAMIPTNLEPYLHASDAQNIYLSSIVGSPDYSENYTPGDSARRNSWWTLARSAPDQYRQRAAFALSEIFVASSTEGIVGDRHYGHAHYYDMLKDGAFASYRDLLEDVSTHPIMGQYLSHLRNSKAVLDNNGDVIVSPDENYAREIMQLFSIGLVQLHEDGSLKLGSSGLPQPTYLQDDISAMARVFTGWSFAKINSPSTSTTIIDNTNFSYGNGSRYYQSQWSNRMKNFIDYHDTEEKIMPTLGLTILTGGDGESDLDATINFLATHPNTAPFISRRLIQRLVTSNPSAGYIYRISQVWKSTNGNLGAVIKAILLDYEARSLSVTESVGFGKKKEPILHLLATLRALDSESQLPLADLDPTDTSVADLSGYSYAPDKLALFTSEIAKFPAGTKRVRMPNTDSTIGQTPLHAPSVFNWFLPDYAVVGPLADSGLRTPEFQIATEISVITNINLVYQLLYWNNGISGNTLRNQQAQDLNGDPHPTYNPYGYDNNDDHQHPNLSSTSSLRLAYLSVMDTNADGKVTSADTTFDDRTSIIAACAALVDHLDLLLTSGRLKSDYASGYISDIVRADNPRDIIINTVANYSPWLDNDDIDENQETVLFERLKLAAYLVASSPQAIIQR